jgi:hypothetical protein
MKFQYTLSGLTLNEDDHYIKKIVFPITPYGSLIHTIKFNDLVTESTAVKAVEAWLSRPADKEYMKSLYDEAWTEFEAEEDDPIHYKCRGEVLGSHIFLEVLHKEKDHNVVIYTGS